MAQKKAQSKQPQDREKKPHQIHLPGFIIDEDIGLGDVIKRATSSVGIRPCAGCERRAAVLNRWVVFTRRRLK